MENIDPIRRHRELAQSQIRTEQGELMTAYQTDIAVDIRLTEAQRDELERMIGGEHHEWFAKNISRIDELLPRNLASVATYEQKRDQFRNQIQSALTEARQISVHSLWGRRSDGQRDPGAYRSVVSYIKGRLGSCRGLAGALDANLNKSRSN